MLDKKRLLIAISLYASSLSAYALEAQAIETPKPKLKADQKSKPNNTKTQLGQATILTNKQSSILWGQWTDLNAFKSNILTKKALEKPQKKYGSGIVGKDEKLLHELDKSSLLDYEPDVEMAPFPPNTPPDEDFATEPESFSPAPN